jgi:hypothetical protein
LYINSIQIGVFLSIGLGGLVWITFGLVVYNLYMPSKEPTPKQLDFWAKYTNPHSPTYSNAVQSALAAGYSKSYALGRVHSVLVPFMHRYYKERLKVKTPEEKVLDNATKYERMLEKAEQNLSEDLHIQHSNDEKLRQLRNKTSMFVAERVGREQWATKTITENKGYTNLVENTLQSLAENLANALGDQQNAPIHADYEIIEAENGDISDEKQGA